ncbi:MAG: hypothetical protein SF182_21140, partial [Deltaproteobacteria bacterium]|nr:hypothetical protein [Deltaproteobacteria bacterium]
DPARQPAPPPPGARTPGAWRVRARRAGRALSLGLGLLVTAAVARSPIFAPFVGAITDGARALPTLLRVDPAATIWVLLLAAAKLGIAVLPALRRIAAAPRRRWPWLLPLAALAVLTTPLSFAACATLGGWLLLLAVTAAAFGLSSWRGLGWTVVLPLLVLWQVVPRHGALFFAQVGTDDPAFRQRLLADCAQRAGTRPDNLRADLLMPYHGINVLGDDLILLTGEGPNDGNMRGRTGGRPAGSWWLRRHDGGTRFEMPSGATGNLWRGCVLNDTIWMARANRIVGAGRPPDDAAAREQRVTRLEVPSRDMDFGETACDPARGRLYVTEALQGGMWETSPDGSDQRRHQIGGAVLLPKRRVDGAIVLTSTAELIVFSPEQARVTERLGAGIANIGWDICPTDGAAAIADASGRLRVFAPGADGQYRFDWGVTLFAPRRVAYSPDCRRLAVTSADDHSVTLIDTATRRVVDVFSAGPALREVAATGPREFSVADVCSLTTYRW